MAYIKHISVGGSRYDLPCYNSVNHIVNESDTSDGVWHYRIFENGFVELFGTKTWTGITFESKSWGDMYGMSIGDTAFPNFPFLLDKVYFKYLTGYMPDNSLLSTICTAMSLDDNGKIQGPGRFNCFRPMPASGNKDVTVNCYVAGVIS